MATYRENQGRLARMAAFWLSSLLVAFGCTFLFEQLVAFKSMREAIGGATLPIVSVDLSPAFLVSSIVCLAGVTAIRIWQQKPKVADLLIDTEAELRKVTWPTLDEVVNASIVVVVFVVFVGAYLGLADMVLARVIKRIIFGA